jgi:threonyl-tRNA synthetase
MPGRFGLVYTDKDGSEKTPVMLHRAILGSYHRFIANLLENTGGALPLWLSPIQIALIPISENHHSFAAEIELKFKEEGLRVEVFDRDDTMQSKIRDAQMRKIPYMFVLGDREVSNKQVSVRTRDNVNIGATDIDVALSKIKSIYLTKSLDLW